MSARRELYAALMAGGPHSPERSDWASALIDALVTESPAELDATRAERDCLAMAVLFARQWSGGTPFELHKGIDEILATMPTAAAPDFFRAGRTYAREHHGRPIHFHVRHVDTPPGSSWRVAFGWRRNEDGDWEPTDSDDFTGWTDITKGEPA